MILTTFSKKIRKICENFPPLPSSTPAFTFSLHKFPRLSLYAGNELVFKAAALKMICDANGTRVANPDMENTSIKNTGYLKTFRRKKGDTRFKIFFWSKE